MITHSVLPVSFQSDGGQELERASSPRSLFAFQLTSQISDRRRHPWRTAGTLLTIITVIIPIQAIRARAAPAIQAPAVPAQAIRGRAIRGRAVPVRAVRGREAPAHRLLRRRTLRH